MFLGIPKIQVMNENNTCCYIYRLDSDVPMPYGTVVKTTSRNKTAFGLEILEEKTGLAAWFVSHCNTVSQRELVVKKLMKHLPDNSVHVRYWLFKKYYNNIQNVCKIENNLFVIPFRKNSCWCIIIYKY